jgi:hypothetical protein
MSFDRHQFKEFIEVILKDNDLYSAEAVDLLMLTAAVETNLGTYLRQVGKGGKGLGVYQCEMDTHTDLYEHYLDYKTNNRKIALRYYISALSPESNLQYNLPYMTIIARLHYYRFSEAIPKRSDYSEDFEYFTGLATYYKKYYNSTLGKSTIKGTLNKYYKHGHIAEGDK